MNVIPVLVILMLLATTLKAPSPALATVDTWEMEYRLVQVSLAIWKKITLLLGFQMSMNVFSIPAILMLRATTLKAPSPALATVGTWEME